MVSIAGRGVRLANSPHGPGFGLAVQQTNSHGDRPVIRARVRARQILSYRTTDIRRTARLHNECANRGACPHKNSTGIAKVIERLRRQSSSQALVGDLGPHILRSVDGMTSFRLRHCKTGTVLRAEAVAVNLTSRPHGRGGGGRQQWTGPPYSRLPIRATLAS